MINEFKLWKYLSMVVCSDGMGYFDFLKYMIHSCVIITDSDGIQQETTVLDVPCISIRDTTNIEYTVNYGTNKLVEPDRNKIYKEAICSERKHTNFPEELKKLNDGKASERMAKIIKKYRF